MINLSSLTHVVTGWFENSTEPEVDSAFNCEDAAVEEAERAVMSGAYVRVDIVELATQKVVWSNES